MPTTGVESVEVSETGQLIGVAWMTDGTITIWQDPAQGSAVRAAERSRVRDLRVYDRPVVRAGRAEWVPHVRQSAEDQHLRHHQPDWCRHQQPQGLVAGTRTFATGDAVRWDSTRTYYSGACHYWPRSSTPATS